MSYFHVLKSDKKVKRPPPLKDSNPEASSKYTAKQFVELQSGLRGVAITAIEQC